MDKKNTMLLTVIAVATLLVAVVGATFAYFSITTNNDSYSKTTVTGQSGKIPTITVTNPKQQLYLKVSTTDMIESNAENDYYAVDTCTMESDASCKSDSVQDHNVIKIAVENGDDDTIYACTGTITIKASGTMYDAIKEGKTGDLTLNLKNYSTDGGEDDSIDLASLSESNGTITRNLKLDITGNDTKDITASLKLHNSEQEQNYLAGKQLTLEIEATDVNCPVKAAN